MFPGSKFSPMLCLKQEHYSILFHIIPPYSTRIFSKIMAEQSTLKQPAQCIKLGRDASQMHQITNTLNIADTLSMGLPLACHLCIQPSSTLIEGLKEKRQHLRAHRCFVLNG